MSLYRGTHGKRLSMKAHRFVTLQSRLVCPEKIDILGEEKIGHSPHAPRVNLIEVGCPRQPMIRILQAELRGGRHRVQLQGVHKG
jgi:hypothetical protein